jgi:hypothetical protein
VTLNEPLPRIGSHSSLPIRRAQKLHWFEKLHWFDCSWDCENITPSRNARLYRNVAQAQAAPAGAVSMQDSGMPATARIRHVAEKLRQMAKEAPTNAFADQFLGLARQYDCLAERVERDPVPPRPLLGTQRG